MRIFKTTYKDRNGKTCEAAKWYIELKDQIEIVRRLPAFKSKAASEEMGRNLEKLVAYHKGSGGQVDPALSSWLTGLPQSIRQKLVEIGLVDAERAAIAKTLKDHLVDFCKSLEAKGGTSEHVDLVRSRVQKNIEGCRFKYFNDMKASKVQDFLFDLRQDKNGKRGISAQTFNFYLSAIKQFCRWMVRDRRAVESPVAHLAGLNVKLDRRHDRRALGLEELTQLIQKTHAGPDEHGLTGPQRSLAYRLAAETGLRSGELRSLTKASFSLNTEPPTVTVAAAYSKHRREDTLPLRKSLADELGRFLAMMTPDTVVFPLPEGTLAGRMFQKDRAAAGIVHRDSAGLVADWHSLRHTFITNLAHGGIHPKTAQTLARHSTITLTMNTYTHSLREDEAKALEVLPDLSFPINQKLMATGTKGSEAVLASCLSFSGGISGIPVDANGPITHNAGNEKTPENTGERPVFPGNFNDRRGGRAADCTGLENRRRRKASESSNLSPSAWKSDAD